MRDNFVRFARMKHERGSKMQVVVQMVRMPGNAHEVEDFRRFWSAVEGVDQVRVKEDETNLVQPEGQTRVVRRAPVPLSLARADVREAGRPGVSVLPELHARRRAYRRSCGSNRLRQIFNSDEMRRLRRLHAAGRAGEIDMCARCCTAVPHPLLVAG